LLVALGIEEDASTCTVGRHLKLALRCLDKRSYGARVGEPSDGSPVKDMTGIKELLRVRSGREELPFGELSLSDGVRADSLAALYYS
jgi:hypothetical protein